MKVIKKIYSALSCSAFCVNKNAETIDVFQPDLSILKCATGMGND